MRRLREGLVEMRTKLINAVCGIHGASAKNCRQKDEERASLPRAGMSVPESQMSDMPTIRPRGRAGSTLRR